MSVRKYLDYSYEDAIDYDRTIDALVPPYQDMLDTMGKIAQSIEWPSKDIIEYGVGTGNLTRQLLHRLPGSSIRGYDISSVMIEVCREKLGESRELKLECHNIISLDSIRKAGLVVASLVIHELEPIERLKILHKTKDLLLKGGWLIIGDIYELPSESAQAIARNLWLDHMRESGISEEEAEAEARIHLVEDRIATIHEQVKSLRELGFENVSVPWQNFNFHIVLAEAQ
jgi:phospholipid N-methyltransferase